LPKKEVLKEGRQSYIFEVVWAAKLDKKGTSQNGGSVGKKGRKKSVYVEGRLQL